MFLAFDYDKEEDYINSMAQKGWQLKKGGLLHHTYERNDQCYRYKLDYNNKVHFSMDEYDRYLAIFGEQGWQHVNSTFNGWHYFRKKYDPALSEEEYCIYTDDNSLREMLGRWNRIVRILQLIYIVFLLFYFPYYLKSKSLIAGSGSIMFILAIALLEVGIINMKRKRVSSKSGPHMGIYGGYILFGGLVLSLLFMFILIFHPPYTDKFEYSTQIDQHTPDYTETLTVKADGVYNLDVKCNSERGLVMIRVLKDNSVIYNGGGGQFTATCTNLKLKAGNYKVEVIYYLEDYEEEFHASQSELEKLHLTGDLDEKSDVDIFVGIRH